jgi:hypothetical protein
MAAEFRDLKFVCQVCGRFHAVDDAAAEFMSQLLDAIPRPSGGKPPLPARSTNPQSPQVFGNRLAFLEAMASPK